ncbi:DUF1254 domain-containing protein [Mycolicibacterium arseniciresistens]|uniref:DUF1254 domain-containing protein n=1 Tax=Mycolicibacterium arseniciresistens TaxID=3062257 RepID=A0ABT8UDY5_9MYCO|nr:DUF1254 domain-containing protein [Mycolicibacterium arseniciresistens]MDO3635994.1 DUF1254 domain-containing protein [Mycolicibacterium arseniciresistens]
MGELPGRLGAVGRDRELPRREDLPLIFDELDYQMACQAYLWALPLVSYAQWQKVHTEVFGAGACDLVVYRTYRDRLGIITANATTPYILAMLDLGETGPLVIELPAGHTAGGISDFWQREIAVLGEMGPERGAGGRHLVLPPGAGTPEHTDDLRVHHASGMNVMFGFRTLDPDPDRAQALVEGVKIYPLADPVGAAPTRLISPDGRPWSGDQPRGMQYWERLHDIYQREIVDERDRFYLAMLAQLGIEKGKPFAPGERLTDILSAAAQAGELMAQANSFAKRFPDSRYWPDRRWDLVLALDESSQRTNYYDQLLERAAWFYEAVSFSAAMKSQTPGLGQAYLSCYTDSAGRWLDGGNDYTLHIPANPPAKLFWSATVYSADTRCLIDNPQQRGDRGSRNPDLAYNDDGSVTLYFGPEEPANHESNWIQTIPDQHWFAYFRLYGPLEAYFDRSWRLADITAAGQSGSN